MIRKLIPWRLQNWLELKHRSLSLGRAMRSFQNDQLQCLDANNSLLNDLFYGWGNEAWSAENEYLMGCISESMKSEGAILECGSGLTTLLIGTISKQRNIEHIVLEHIPEWADKMKAQIARFGLGNTQLNLAPIKHHDTYSWYDASKVKSDTPYSLVVCDGPPSSTKGGRYGLMPLMFNTLEKGCKILLDDADRQEEHEIVKQWQADFSLTSKVIGDKKPYFEIQLL